jgi:sugar phosphate isomerase/epimerase
MHPRLSVHGLCSREWSLAQDIAFYRSAGIEAVTVPFIKLAPDVEGGIAAIQAANLRPTLVAGGPGTPLIKGLEVLNAPIDAAKALGVPAFYSISGAAPHLMPTDEAFPMLLAALEPVRAYALGQGVRLAIENNSIATRSHGFVHTLADTALLAREADIDICLELQNCWYERGLPKLFRENMARIAVVQVSDFRVGEDLRLNRRVPGDGSIPLEWLFGQLLDAGYGGLFDLEILGPHIEAEGYASAIGRGLDWLSERLARWGV